MSDQWFYERSFHQNYSQGHKVLEVLHEEQSKWQKIEVINTASVGKLLLLDGKTMVSDLDEFVYHEVMAHVSYSVLPSVKNVLIIGGGDGGVVREFVKHKDIERIDLVEIDERVIEVSKKFFPEVASGLTDPRVRILPEDGIKFIEGKQNEYDIIIVDSTDPEDFASGLFTKDFYQKVNNALTDQGIMMNQTENPFYDEFGIKNIYDNLRNAFPMVKALRAPMPIYPGVFWTFGASSKKHPVERPLESKKEYMNSLDTRFYNPDWHVGAFMLDNFTKSKMGIK